MTSLLPEEGEYLTTGWEPDLPATDSLVRQAVLVHASWATELAQRSGRPWRRTSTWAGGYVGERGQIVNWVVPVAPPADWEVMLDEVAALVPVPAPYVMVSPWPTPDLGDLGLVKVGHPPLMLRLPGELPGGPPRTDLTVREVSSPAELETAERVLVEGYPMPELQPLRPGDLYDPSLLDGPNRVWIAWDGAEAVATSVAHHAHGATLVECVAVLPRARGRGAGAAVTWAAAASEPDAPSVLIASDEGQPVYERLGFLRVERWTAWIRT